jgi:hypothetical protein
MLKIGVWMARIRAKQESGSTLPLKLAQLPRRNSNTSTLSCRRADTRENPHVTP